MRKSLLVLALFLQTALIGYFIYEIQDLKKRLYSFQKKTFPLLKRNEVQTCEIQLLLEKQLQIREFPLAIKHVPFADKQGIVLSVKEVNIPGMVAPYNASLVEGGDPYLLFFRYDTPVIGIDEIPFYSHIGCVSLNRDFSPVDSYFTLNTNSPFSEDPRAVQLDGKYLITFNDLICEGDFRRRGVRLASFDRKQRMISDVKAFDRKNFAVEKNWMPFISEEEELQFVYTVSPHEIVQMPSPEAKQLVDVLEASQMSILSHKDWPAKWGFPRGGTPPRLIDGEYLSFFHSSFDGDNGLVWYIMGAYTFEAQAPYRITKISAAPIFFDGIYTTAHINTANPRVRCIYPAGLALENRDGRDLIHLSCGENDSAVKIVTFDKEALLRSMKPVGLKTIGEKVAKMEGCWGSEQIFKRQ